MTRRLFKRNHLPQRVYISDSFICLAFDLWKLSSKFLNWKINKQLRISCPKKKRFKEKFCRNKCEIINSIPPNEYSDKVGLLGARYQVYKLLSKVNDGLYLFLRQRGCTNQDIWPMCIQNFKTLHFHALYNFLFLS